MKNMRKILTLILCIFVISSNFALAKNSKLESTEMIEDSGYIGTLPDVEERFQKSQTKEVLPSFDYKDGFNDPDSIKPTPRDNPSFINIIMKKDKTSQYINDLNDLILIIEKLQDIIESGKDVQKFNAQAFFFRANAEYFRDKYQNRAEESFISYRKVLQLNTQVQAIAQLRQEKEVYSPYVTAAGSGNVFSSNNIENQLNYLDENIKKTLAVLKNTR